MEQTDVDVMRAMLKRAGIEFTDKQEDNGKRYLTVEAGYIGFVSVLEFKPDGSLESITAWE